MRTKQSFLYVYFIVLHFILSSLAVEKLLWFVCWHWQATCWLNNLCFILFIILHQYAFNKHESLLLWTRASILWSNDAIIAIYYSFYHLEMPYNNSCKSINHVHLFNHSRRIDRYFMLTYCPSGWIDGIVYNLCLQVYSRLGLDLHFCTSFFSFVYFY